MGLETLAGKWYIHFSDFPMWLKGDKKRPTFNYTIVEKKGIKGLKDAVVYEKNGKQKAILGFDTPTDATNTQFVWRGYGFLFFAKSNWKIIYIDSRNTWAVIQFEKTLFTPAGFDIISKNEKIEVDLATKMLEIFTKLNPHATLQRIEQ